MSDDLKRRQNLTFLQSEGFEELPRQMKREEMPRLFRLELWQIIHKFTEEHSNYDSLGGCFFTAPWDSIATGVWIHYFKKPHTTRPSNYLEFNKYLGYALLNDKWHDVYELLTIITRHSGCTSEVKQKIKNLLKKHSMAYYLDTSGPSTFVPVFSQEQAMAISDALSITKKHFSKGAYQHLRNAVENINQGDYAGAVRESIHSVESLAKVISGKDKATLSDALKELQNKKITIHETLLLAFNKLYGYTSDEKGVRHALLETKANVNEEEALFMFGACASFCGYLCRKWEKVKK